MRHFLFVALFVLASILQIFPRIWEQPIARGQLSKQTYVAEMAKSFNEGKTQGIFAKRHFLEPYHPGPIAWAEEVPVQVGLVSTMHRYTAIDYNVAGKIISFLCFLALLAGAYKIGGLYFIIPFALFPIFRIYGSLNLPELGMAASCLWAIYFARNESWGRAMLLLTLAIAWKYYAIFTAIGLAFYAVRTTKRWRTGLLLLLSILPSAAYLFYFLQIGIANPILEYRELSGAGHFSAWKQLFSLAYLSRLVTWNLVKNPTLIGSFLALLGSITLWYIRDSEKKFIRLLLCLGLGQLIFALAFSSSFFVHDYYGIQIALILALMAGYGIRAAFQMEGWQQAATAALLLGLFILSHKRYTRATLPQFCYAEAAIELNTRTSPQSWGIWIMDGYGESALYMADRTAWMLANKTWMQFNKLTESGTARLLDPRAEWLAILLTGEDPEGRWRWIRDKIAPFGWTKIAYMKKNFNGKNLVSGENMPNGFSPLPLALGEEKDLLTASFWLLQRELPKK